MSASSSCPTAAAPARSIEGRPSTGTEIWREGYVQGGGTRFWVRAMGQGDDLVVLLHGWPEDGTMWREVAPRLVAAGHRVVCPDLKGFGRSDKPRRGYDPQTLGDEIGQLIGNLDVQEAVVVGHDWGGVVARATAFRRPERVRSVVVASAPHRELDVRRAFHIPLLNVPVVPELAFRVAPEPLLRRAFQHAAVVQEPFTDEVIAHYAAILSSHPSGWLSYYRRFARRAVLDRTVGLVRDHLPVGSRQPSSPRQTVPALVLWGEEDPVTPVHLAPGVASDLDGDLVVVPGVGHFVPEEDPVTFTRAVLDHLGAG